MYRWFTGGRLNTCFNALDRHVQAGRGDQAALIYDSPVTETQKTYTFTQLRDEVARFAGVLTTLGVAKGDRVVIYMPMVPEALIAMLACARIGAVHSVVFGGFAAKELATRINDAKPKVIISAHRAASSPTASCSTSRCWMRRSNWPRPNRALRHPPAPAGPGRDDRRARPRLGGRPRKASEPVDCVSVRRPIRCTSSTPPARRAYPRASCATTAGTRWR
jgi:hypothetical protein